MTDVKIVTDLGRDSLARVFICSHVHVQNVPRGTEMALLMDNVQTGYCQVVEEWECPSCDHPRCPKCGREMQKVARPIQPPVPFPTQPWMRPWNPLSPNTTIIGLPNTIMTCNTCGGGCNG